MSFIRSFIKNLYVCVFVDNTECSIFGKFVKNQSDLGTIEADFEITEKHIDFKFNDYIKKNTKKAHSTYVALLLSTKKQWALPVADRVGYNQFGVNYNEVQVVNMPGGWSIFISNDEIANQTKFLNGLKPDLLYSPYVLLYEKICEFRADDRITLYVYAQDTSCTMMVFAGLQMRYAAYFCEGEEEKMAEEDTIAPINIADIDNIIAKEDDKFSALNALNDLDDDNFELNGQFCDITKVEDVERSGDQIEESLQKVGRSGNMLNNIKEAMKEYYRNPLYQSEFIEKIVVFDSQDVLDEQSFIDVVGHEIFVDSAVFKVDRNEDLLSIIKREINP